MATETSIDVRVCGRKDLIMQRSLNEEWSVTPDGGIDCFLGDGGASEFSNYWCEACECVFDIWAEAIEHLKRAA